MQPRKEKFFTLFSKASSNVVESAAILMESSPRHTSAGQELAKRVHDTEHADDTTKRRVVEDEEPGPLRVAESLAACSGGPTPAA